MNKKSAIKQALILTAGLLAAASAQAQTAPATTTGATVPTSNGGAPEGNSTQRPMMIELHGQRPSTAKGNSPSQGVTVITIQTPNTPKASDKDAHKP